MKNAIVAFTVGGAATAAFVIVRNARDLEESAFFVTLAGFSVAAALVAGVVAFVITRRCWLRSAALAAFLVPALYVWYLVVELIICGITGCDKS